MGELARIGGSGTSVTRLGLSSEEQRARDLVGGWLAARGAHVRRDPAANLRAHGGRGDPALARRGHKEFVAYCELHIEQGPRLDQAGLALGVVDAIVGIYHARVTVRGRADHAGATVMTARADALAAAAEIV